jgi:hypothetical protein
MGVIVWDAVQQTELLKVMVKVLTGPQDDSRCESHLFSLALSQLSYRDGLFYISQWDGMLPLSLSVLSYYCVSRRGI